MTDLGGEPLAEHQAIVWRMAAESILLFTDDSGH